MKSFFYVLFLGLLIVALSDSATLAADCNLKIITELSPPSAYEDDEGDVIGFGVEIVEAIKKELGCDTPIEVMPWARGYKFLQTQPDVMLFSTSRTKAREALFQWIGPVACYNWVFYGRKNGRKLSSLSEAKKVSGIGVYRDDARAQFLKSMGFTNLEVTDSQKINFKKLIRGRIELVATSDIGVKEFLKNDKELLNNAVPVLAFRKLKLYMAFSKSTDPAKVLLWQKAFDALQKRGVIKGIQEKWIQPCPD